MEAESIEIIAYVVKLFFGFATLLLLFIGKHRSGLFIGLLIFFMTGVEMSLIEDQPWTFLLSSSSGIDDYKSAAIGGLFACFFAVVLYITAYVTLRDNKVM